MSASPSPKGPPALSSVREEFSSPDDGDARGVPGDFGVRAAARILDLIFLVGLGFGVALGVNIVLVGMARAGSIAPTWQVKVSAITLGSFGWSIVGTTLYYTLSEAVGGATVGKWICGLRVYSADFSPDGTFLVALRRCTLSAALVRSLVFFIDSLFFCALAYGSMEGSRWRQRFGDKWGHTVVVKARSTDLPAKSAIPGVLVGILATSAITAMSLVLKML